jgi:oxidoreductase
MFCCLGSRVKYGDEQFKKVDYSYVHYGALIAKKNEIPHFGVISSMGADKKSLFLYPRTKGLIEETLKSLQFPVLSIFRPGLLVDRDNDKRWGEILFKYIPFVPKIDSKDMARAMMREAELILERKNISKTIEVNIYDNSQIKSLLKEKS